MGFVRPTAGYPAARGDFQANANAGLRRPAELDVISGVLAGVNITPMTNCHDKDHKLFVMDFIDDSVIPDPDSHASLPVSSLTPSGLGCSASSRTAAMIPARSGPGIFASRFGRAVQSAGRGSIAHPFLDLGDGPRKRYRLRTLALGLVIGA